MEAKTRTATATHHGFLTPPRCGSSPNYARILVARGANVRQDWVREEVGNEQGQ